MMDDAHRKWSNNATESKTLSMRGNSMPENREIPAACSSSDRDEQRSAKATGRTADMDAVGKSDGRVVPRKQANNTGIQPAAEPVEGRGPTKGNAEHSSACRTQSRKDVLPGMNRVREAARRDSRMQFTALLHHVTPQLLQSSFYQLKREAAPGVDEVTWREYERGLSKRLAVLHDHVHRGTYHAQPSKRVWVPKADGRQRPIGIAALEDKIVQRALRAVLEQIYEEDFLGFSYGFRPGRSCHHALDALWVGLTERKVNWVLDADIRGFFDAIDHGWLEKFLKHRIADRRVLRLIRKWLRAGVSEDGQWSKTTVGTAQGSVISPLLANVFLHYVFDLWVNVWRKSARGDVIVVRYADDFVMGFQHRGDAERFLRELSARFAKFGLELHSGKTRLIEFGRFASERRAKRRQGRPETFDFLGFTHLCGKARTQGWFTVHRRSIAKRFRSKLQVIKRELRKRQHTRLGDVGRWLRSVVQGWYNYHAVPGNWRRLDQFRAQVTRLWLQSLRRRSQRGRRRWDWSRMHHLAERWLPHSKILHPYPDARFRVCHPR